MPKITSLRASLPSLSFLCSKRTGRLALLLSGLALLFLPLIPVTSAEARTSLDFASLPTAVSSQKVQVASSTGVYLGVSVREWGAADLIQNLSQFQADARKKAALVMYWRDWAGSGQVEPQAMNAIYAQGSVPVISWGPGCWTHCDPSIDYSLDAVVKGNFDSYVRSFADSLRAYNRPVLLRFNAEMNWCAQGIGCPGSTFVAAWRHLHDLFLQEGATNVQWVWCPNIDWDGQHPFSSYYPGNAYVNWLGLDGYNRTWNRYQSFATIFSASMKELDQINRTAPIMIGETGSAEATTAETASGQTKASWIANTYASGIPSFPRVKAVIWFNEDKSSQEGCPCDWRIESSASATSAYAQSIARGFYLSRWS